MVKERRSGADRRQKVVKVQKDMRTGEERRVHCEACGNKMTRIEKEVPNSAITYPALYCKVCNNLRFIQTQAVIMARVVNLLPSRRKLIRLGQNLAVTLPNEFSRAFNLDQGQEVEISVDGFSKIAIRIV